MDDELKAPGVSSKSPSREKRPMSPPSRESSRERSRKRKSRSRDRRRKRSYSRSRSPLPFRGGGFRGNRNNNRFGRRSPFRGQRSFNRFNDRRSRSRSRENRFDNNRGRRFDRNRRSRSDSPIRENYNMQAQAAAPMYNDGYGNYIPNAPAPPQFGSMPQFNSYDFQGASGFAPQAPAFNVPGISCPGPPGMAEGWIPPPQPEETEEERLKREAAVAEEKKRQREGLKKQRDQYISRSEKMKRELKELKQQKSDLVAGHGKRSPSPKTNGFIKENEKLQSQISSKLSEILNVIDMLNGIIGKDVDEETSTKKKSSKKSKKSESDTSPERIKTELLESMKKKKKEAEDKKEKINYIVYDPELHWCKACQVFPKTAKDYLVHLHTKEHSEKTANKSAADAPWRESFKKANDVPSYPDAPTKRTPIRGLQFFEPATAWFCKLCEVFMGDTWCASQHLKSEIHTEKYAKFVEKEPKFEDKWLEARKKAFEMSDKNGKPLTDNEKQRKEEKKSKKKKNKRDKKKKNRVKKRKRGSTSSSSSNSDNSDSSSESNESAKKNESDQNETKNSIRVTMRNLLNDAPSKNDERTGKWTMVSANAGKPVPPPAPSISRSSAQEKKKDDQIIGQWSTLDPIISQEEKRLLEHLKGRLKTQQSEASEKSATTSRRADEKEKVREREPRDRSREPRETRDRSREVRDRSREPRDRSRERSRGDRNYRGRRSRSRSRSRSRGRYRRYSRSRSNSRGRRRVERPIVNFPEPRLPPNREDKKLPARSYVISKKEDTSSNAKKVMPMIGKMPVFKKQLSDKKTEETVEEKVEEEQPVEAATEEKQPRDDTWDDYMPDPLQYSALMGAPPPPPRATEEPEVVPPGLDPEQDDIPKPISDAPIARKGPLPKDFQDTLDLLYDGDTPKPVVIEPKFVPDPVPIEPPPIVMSEDGPQMIMAEDLSQHALLYGGFYTQNSEDSTAPQTVTDAIALADESIYEDVDQAESKANGTVEVVEMEESAKDHQMDMDDLAMLGIDVDDVGSGMW